MTLFLLALLTGVGLFLLLANYDRKEVVSGILTPVDGVVKIAAVRAGLVSSVEVKEGETVAAGATLFTLSVDYSVEGGGSVGAMALSANDDQQRSAQDQLGARLLLTEAKANDIEIRRRAYKEKIGLIDDRLGYLNKQYIISKGIFEDAAPLAEKGIVSYFQLRQWEYNALTIQASISSAQGERADVMRALSQLDAEQSQLVAQKADDNAQIAASRAQIRERQAGNLGQKLIIIKADHPGKITAVQVVPGRVVAAGALLANLLPPNAELKAQLYIPSKAIGFLSAGDRVRLMYDSFPYQRFGSSFGRVSKIAGTPIDPADLTGGIQAKEALYPVDVVLDRQSVAAYGRTWRLTPGMRLTADVILEKQSLVSWLFDPLIAARERTRVAPL